MDFANKAKEAGYIIYTVGIGEGVNAPFLRELATTPEDYDQQFFYRAITSKELGGIYENISDALCERGPAIIDIIPRIEDTVI